MSPDFQQLYFEIITRHLQLPAIPGPGVVTWFEGNDHVVLVVDGSLVFRFPKLPGEIDSRPSDFLRLLRPMSPLRVPEIEIHHDDVTGMSYETHEFIPGVSFVPLVARTFSHENLLAVARQLGAFLGVVHSFPIDRARSLRMDEMRPEGFGDYMESHPNAFPMVKRLVYPYLSKGMQEWVETLFADYIALIGRAPFRTRVTHADMWTYHIIVDSESCRVTGVIDFWGRIADPANDFKPFEYYGSSFVDEVYRSYPLVLDEGFETRRLFYTGHDEVFQLARVIEREDETEIEAQLQCLVSYIDTHPYPLG